MFKLFACFTSKPFTKVLATIFLGIAVASCADTDGPPADLLGVASTGLAVQGTVFVVDAEGVELSRLLNIDGSFKFDVRQLTAPFMLKTVAGNNVDPDLYSYAENATSNVNEVVNITSLTNLVMSIANSEADLAILYDSWSSSFTGIDPASVKDIQARVNMNLSTLFTAFSIDPLSYDFFGKRFIANSTSVNAMLKQLTIDTSAGISFIVEGVAVPFAYNPSIDITATDIGGTIAALTGNYSLSRSTVIDAGAAVSTLLAINLPAASVPTVPTGNIQIVEDTFGSFYGSVGDIVINTTVASFDTVTASTIIAVIDATITTPEAVDKNYVDTYTYTLNP